MKQRRKPAKTNDGIWEINGSTLDLLSTCPKKLEYTFKSEPRETEATEFGSAIHAALAAFYLQDFDKRQVGPMVEAFNKYVSESSIMFQPIEIKGTGCGRSIENGVKIINSYYDTWKNDPWIAYVDDKGPFVEREFEIPLNDKIIYFGTMDIILKHKDTGELKLMDHKTSRTISNIPNRVKPCHQLTGYWFACKYLGIPITSAAFQGIQVAKTLHQSIRCDTNRTDEDFAEWLMYVSEATARLDVYFNKGLFPMNGSTACMQYGTCKYIGVCQAPISMRSDLLKNASEKEEENG